MATCPDRLEVVAAGQIERVREPSLEVLGASDVTLVLDVVPHEQFVWQGVRAGRIRECPTPAVEIFLFSNPARARSVEARSRGAENHASFLEGAANEVG